MTDHDPDSSQYELYGAQRSSQPYSSLSASLLGPDPRYVSRLVPSWPVNFPWPPPDGYQGMPQAVGPEEQDDEDDDFYNNQDATPNSMPVEGGGQFFTSGNNSSSHPSSVFQSGEATPAESTNHTAVHQNQHLSTTIGPNPNNRTLDGNDKAGWKQTAMEVITPSQRAAELKMKLVAAKLAAGKSTPTQDKMGAKSSTPAASDGKPTSLPKENQMPTTRSPSTQMTAVADTSNALPDRSAMSSEKSQETKLSPKANGQANGVNGVAEKDPSHHASPTVSAVHGDSSSHLQMHSSDRINSSNAIDLDDLLAEFSVNYPGPAAPNNSIIPTTEATSTGEPAVRGAVTTHLNGGDFAMQQVDPISSGTSEQGEIREEPSIPTGPAPKTYQKSNKPSDKPSKNKVNTVQRSDNMPLKKLFQCDMCSRDFGHEDDLARHKNDTHPPSRPAERSDPKSDDRRQDYGRADSRRTREEMSRPDPPSRPRENRRYSDDRFDRYGASRYEPYARRERYQDSGTSRQPNSSQLVRHNSITTRDPVPPPRGNTATEKNSVPKPQATTNESSSKRTSKAEETLKHAEAWLEFTGFYKCDEEQREAKINRWRRVRELSEEKERLELEESMEKEAEQKARAQARAKARASAARAPTTLPVDPIEAPTDAVPPPALTCEVAAPTTQAQVAPTLPNDDIGLRIKDSALRSTETSPMQPTFAAAQNPLNTSALSTPSLKRRVPTNDQLPNARIEKLPRLDTDNRSSDALVEDPVSATRTQPTGGTDDPQSAPRSRDMSAHGPIRGRFRSRSPVQRRDSDFLIYDDPDPIRSRDISPRRINEYESYRPGSPNVIEGAYERDRNPNDRPRDDYQRRGEYQSYGYGRGGDAGRGGRGGHRGFAQRGNTFRGGRGNSIERDGGRYPRR